MLGLPEGSHPQPQRKTSFRPLIGDYAQLEHIRPNNPRDSIQCCRPSWHLPDLWENVLCQWFYQFGNMWVPWSHSVVEQEWGRMGCRMDIIVHCKLHHRQEILPLGTPCADEQTQYALHNSVGPFRLPIGLWVVCRTMPTEPSPQLRHCCREMRGENTPYVGHYYLRPPCNRTMFSMKS
jgi:hypothetical protein